MIKAVLFDLDGTLVDTAPDLAAALNTLLTRRGKPTLPFSSLRQHASSGARGMIFAGFGIEPGHPEYSKTREAYLDIYQSTLCVNSRLFDGMENVLEHLESRTRPWGIVTNKPESLAAPLLETLTLKHRAKCVICGDTTPHPKPDPAGLILAAEKLCLPPSQCLYVGDDLRDIQAAKAAGMPVLAAAYGYLGKHSSVRDWNADGVIYHPPEILDWLALTPC